MHIYYHICEGCERGPCCWYCSHQLQCPLRRPTRHRDFTQPL